MSKVCVCVCVYIYMLFIKTITMLFLFCIKVMSDSNYHTKTDSQSIRKLNFEDEDSPVIVEQPEPISIDSNDKFMLT